MQLIQGLKQEEFIPISIVPVRHGRGASFNPPTRFDNLYVEEDPAALEESEIRQIETEVFVDTSRSALARNNSPDVPFTYSLNPYRGCEHGCIYCYARPSHEYLGFSAGIDFETKIVVKRDAPELLSRAFEKANWEPQVVALSGNTDPYQPLERKLKITRRCLEVFREFRNPVSVVTKNHLVTRDADVLSDLACLNLVHVTLSITSLRPEVLRVMEPRASHYASRLKAIETLASRGIPVGVNIAPIIPGLTDEEMPEIMKRAADAGATRANYLVIRLPGPVRPLFLEWLSREFPNRKNKVVNRLRSLRGDRLTDGRFGHRHAGGGQWADIFNDLFRMTGKKLGLADRSKPLSTEHFASRRGRQVELF